MIVDVSWNGKKVLIVGAGKQGKKKEALLKAEGADVRSWIKALTGVRCGLYDLVVACTNDARVNHEIVVQAQKEGVFAPARRTSRTRASIGCGKSSGIACALAFRRGAPILCMERRWPGISKRFTTRSGSEG